MAAHPSTFRPDTRLRAMSSVRRLCWSAAYYGVLQFLPSSTAPGGAAWRWIRACACQHLFETCGRDVCVEPRAHFSSGRQIRIGDHSGIGPHARISGPVTLGANVMMAPEVVILTGGHGIARTDIPMIAQGRVLERPVTVADDVWIGTRAIILPGVTVGPGAVIGAGAVVVRDVPARAVVVGNPARIVRFRGTEGGARSAQGVCNSGMVPAPSPQHLSRT